ncbi:hypothetical protein WOLCODRAFT_26929 [Wolfiporia cocos MD-104 SS10]|uniref:Protein transport protein SEC31 n=1 Tax=Wolfiporia cocos (strain MD-104) TaxID=742152 RepID=A0A2H3K6H2_WOLCO|nr:hypothetical protein WOLCODRAFT_26929 [Wolfiporia cocos MD-104 SS10]
MKLKQIHRTSTFVWSPLPSLPLLATGTVAGTLDESFSNNGQLDIWAPDFLDKNEYDLGTEGKTGLRASVTTTSRFNRLAWGYADGGREQGVIVAGMENGELDIWDPAQIVASADPTESLILRNKTHTGPVRGLDFNPIQTNLFSSGAINGEIYIWDLKDPSKPYSPGTRSTKLDEITALAWNHHVQYALAASSNTGYTVVWDLRGKREVAALAYGGGAGTLAGGMQGFGPASMAVGGRRGMSDVAWHPDNATRLVTSSEDDASPVIMVWDLRNARAPEKILTGHEKGVLSLSWCKQDPDLLLSCGKDNRALCWNPQTSEIVGELPSADNWAFQVQWCPRNPDLFAAAFFGGTIGIHSIQSTNEANELPPITPQPDGSDVFNAPGFARASQATLSLKTPPKWLRRPISGSFGYGGKLVSVSNLPSAQGRTQSSVVHIRKVVTEASIVERATTLQAAVEGEMLGAFAEERSSEVEQRQRPEEASVSWRALLSLFKANSRDELITLLGFSKDEIAARVAEAVANLKAASETHALSEDSATETELRPPVVSFAEPESEVHSDSGEDGDETLDAGVAGTEATPSEVSASAASDNTNTPLADGESTTTAPSLFGDELIGTPQMDAAADFFGSIGTARSAEDHIRIPHTNYALDSSVAATIGSGPSSVASEVLKGNTFRIYPADESETDRLVTKALVLGDFESAVSLCLSSNRFADAILLAVKGGSELLQRTQKAYFERQTTALPYLRVFQSIVTNDLADIVQNADLQEWQEIFVVLCTFASQEEFSGLAEQLGQRLEFQANVAKASEAADAEARAIEFRRNATLTYLAAGRLERLVNIWIEELAEEERQLVSDDGLEGSRYTAHALALQTFIEKVTVFRQAIRYEDLDLAQKSSDEDAEVRAYKLSGLYDRYFEYADLLSAQGLVKEAVEYLKLTPEDYHGSPGSALDFKVGRERLLKAASTTPVLERTAPLPAAASRAAPIASTGSSYATSWYTAPVQQSTLPAAPSVTSMYDTYNPVGAAPSQSADPYAPAGAPMQPKQPYQSTAHMSYTTNPYARPSSQPQHATIPQALQQPNILAPPPRGLSSTPSAPPPPSKRENGGWNDAPSSVAQRRAAGGSASRPAAIMSPFPNAPASPGLPSSPFAGHGQPPQALPPPPRPGSVQSRPPPPPQGQRMPPPPQGTGPYPARPPSGPPQPMAPPPGRVSMISPPPAGPGRGPPPAGGPVPYGMPPPVPQSISPPQPGMPGPSGPYARATPPPQAQPQFVQRLPPPPQQLQPPQQQAPVPQSPQPGSYVPPLPRMGPGAPPQGGPPRGGTPGSGASAPPARAGPPPPKYPPGDRSHIPEEMRPVYTVISGELERLKGTTPPQQRRLVDDLERRINPLFDALNCETLSRPVCEKLLVLTRAMDAHDREAAMGLHMDLLTTGSLTDDIGLWMSGVKQLIVRL